MKIKVDQERRRQAWLLHRQVRRVPWRARRYHDKDIAPHIGAKQVREITAEDVRSVIWRKKQQGFDAAAGQIRGLLKRMLDDAITCGLLDHNPVMVLPRRHVYRAAARDRALTPEGHTTVFAIGAGLEHPSPIARSELIRS